MRIAAPWGVFLICLGTLALGCSHPSVDCPKAFKTCGEICVDTATDVANCGACGTACAAGQVCSAGTCATTCQTGLTACGGSCRDLQTDAANCGACGTACTPGLYCIAGACGCPAELPECGPKALVYYDGTGLGGTTDSPAVGAISALKGGVISTKSDAAFATAYDLGGFDLIVYDAPASGFSPSAPMRLYDWVNCGGRLALTTYYSVPWESSLFGVTLLGYNPLRTLNADPASPVNFWSGYASFPSPLTFTPGTPVFAGGNGTELTLATPGSGFLAARLDSATGPGAIAVTNANRSIVNGFLSLNFRGVDNNANGVADVQELFENEILYLMKQGGLTCSAVETFDVGTWPIAPWTLAPGGTAYGSLTGACAHDGAMGFSDVGGGGGSLLPDWYYRTDVTVGAPGQKISMWVKTPATASNGRVLLGFGATPTSTWSLELNSLSSLLTLWQHPTYASWTTLASVSQAFTAATWYRLEVEFGTSGAVTGRVYAADGVTVVNTVTATLAGFAAGGLALHTFQNTCVDTVKVYH